jgi:hypothetical protein
MDGCMCECVCVFLLSSIGERPWGKLVSHSACTLELFIVAVNISDRGTFSNMMISAS